jgi:hypothetical protein
VIRKTRRRAQRAAIVSASVASITFPALIAHAQTWDGGGADNLWSTPANWSADTQPANNGTANIVMAGTTRLTSSVDPAYDVNSVTFDPSAGPFTLKTFDSSKLTVRNGGITNNSANTQTFGIDVTTASSSGENWNASSGPLLFNKPWASACCTSATSRSPAARSWTCRTTS